MFLAIFLTLVIGLLSGFVAYKNLQDIRQRTMLHARKTADYHRTAALEHECGLTPHADRRVFDACDHSECRTKKSPKPPEGSGYDLLLLNGVLSPNEVNELKARFKKDSMGRPIVMPNQYDPDIVLKEYKR